MTPLTTTGNVHTSVLRFGCGIRTRVRAHVEITNNNSSKDNESGRAFNCDPLPGQGNQTQ